MCMLLVLLPIRIRESSISSQMQRIRLCLSFADTSSSTKYQHRLYPIYCNNGLCTAFHFTPGTENHQCTCLITHQPAQQKNTISLMYHHHESVSIYLYIITMHVSTYLALSPVPTSRPNGFSGSHMPPNMGDQSRLTRHRSEAQSPALAALASP